MVGASLLPRSFVLLPGIGPTRELRLWKRGVDNWAAYRDTNRVPGIKPRLKAHHDELLARAETCLGTDAPFFARMLPSSEHWRAYQSFARHAAFLDIETTGDRINDVTVVGVHMGGQDRAFVRGQDYTPEAVSAHLQSATCIVTFNGASFDLPRLAADGVEIPKVPHVDLRHVFSRIGYAGGLKKIEVALGVTRDDGLDGLTGWDAVKMWRRWTSRGDQAALDTLVAYNVADCVNLKPLADFACDKLATQTIAEITAQTHLDADAPAISPAGP